MTTIFLAASWWPWSSKPPDPEPTLYNFSASLFLVFFIFLILAISLPFINKSQFVQRLKPLLRIPVVLAALGGIVLGAFNLLSMLSASSLLDKVGLFQAAIAFIFSAACLTWAFTPNLTWQTACIKAITTCIGFYVALSFLVDKGKDVINIK